MYSIYYDETKGWKLEYCSFITIHLLVKLSTSVSDLVHVPKHQNSKKKYPDFMIKIYNYWQKEDKIFDISNTANPINNKLDFKRDHLS